MSGRKKLFRGIVLGLVLIMGALIAVGCQEQAKTPEPTQSVSAPSETAPKVKEDPFPGAAAYLWEIKYEKAVLTGLVDTGEKDVLIPAEVMLSVTEQGVVHDGQNGTVYPVTVGAAAFCGTDIETVTFSDGVMVEGNTMCAFAGGKGMFQNCAALKTVSNIPDEVTSMKNAFFGCAALETAPELPTSLTDMSGCFKNCVALKEMPVIPDGVKNISSCFSGCTALVSTGLLPDSIENMESAFDGCSALTEVKNIPESTDNMKRAFRDCVSLKAIPLLPERYVAYNGCFSGCVALTGTVEIPAAVAAPVWEAPGTQDMFRGCENLEGIILNCCKNAYAANHTPENIPVTVALKHVKKGECPGCHYVTDDYTVDGMKVRMDFVPNVYVPILLEILDNEVPDELKEKCSKMVFSVKEKEYYKKYKKSGWWGIAFNSSGLVVCLTPDMPNIEYSGIGVKEKEELVNYYFRKGTIFHELGHCYDFNFKTTKRYSDSAAWKKIHKEEWKAFESHLDSPLYTKNDYREETFAEATEWYFMQPDKLKEECPKMYDYLDDLYGNMLT